MGFARAADVPVILVGDIDCGGVIASIAGTKTVIDPRDAAMIKAFLINKFRGDIQLFDEGYAAIETLTGWKGLGIDRKSVVEGKSGSVRVDIEGRRYIKKKKK